MYYEILMFVAMFRRARHFSLSHFNIILLYTPIPISSECSLSLNETIGSHKHDFVDLSRIFIIVLAMKLLLQ
jgi:hypothetical protein